MKVTHYLVRFHINGKPYCQVFECEDVTVLTHGIEQLNAVQALTNLVMQRNKHRGEIRCTEFLSYDVYPSREAKPLEMWSAV